ncbi:MAG TPA: DUF6636 domain-containing protein [Nostocaceae cyanobacterium]|nr:DUF6636 domain-containing protein [Nostocaceae cyanobacterium]
MKFINIWIAIATLTSTATLVNINTFVAQANVHTKGFQTPTGNIHCTVYDSELRCDIRENTAKLPTKPKDCPLDWGNAFAMNLTGKPSRICHGDTIYNPEHPVLKYGQTWRKNGFVCTSKTTGVTCTNRNKKGWELSKEKQRLF